MNDVVRYVFFALLLVASGTRQSLGVPVHHTEPVNTKPEGGGGGGGSGNTYIVVSPSCQTNNVNYNHKTQALACAIESSQSPLLRILAGLGIDLNNFLNCNNFELIPISGSNILTGGINVFGNSDNQRITYCPTYINYNNEEN